MTRKLHTEPVSTQLTRALRAELGSGRYTAGARFPSEREIADRYGISRVTANKVLSGFVAEGLLEFRKGLGAFVAGRPGIRLSLREMESFTAQARAQGMKPATRVLAFREIEAAAAPGAVRKALGGGRLVEFDRLRLADGVPSIHERRWVVAAQVPGLKPADLSGSFYALLENRYGITMAAVSQTVTARSMGAIEARRLRVREGAPALVVEGPGERAGGVAVWYQVLYYRADRHEFRNDIRVRPAGGAPTVDQRKLVVREVAA